MKKNTIFVVAARPNFVKMAPILRAFDSELGSRQRTLVHLGQHYDEKLSQVFFDELGISKPYVKFFVGSGSHGRQTANALILFEKLLLEFSGNIAGVVVVGDVNSTLAATLAACKLNIPVAHVEAGLRSFDNAMPEEINRKLVDAVSSVLFVSEKSGILNLKREGIRDEAVHLVGNVMIDTLAYEMKNINCTNDMKRFVLVTLHRPSNVDDRNELKNIIKFLGRISNDLEIIFPVHPRTMKNLMTFDLVKLVKKMNITMIEPLSYRENIGYMSRAKLVITDSGGVQEETSFLGVPCLTLRKNTERPSTVEFGTNTLVGNDYEKARLLVDDILDGKYKVGKNIPLWDGAAAKRIVAVIKSLWY